MVVTVRMSDVSSKTGKKCIFSIGFFALMSDSLKAISVEIDQTF